MVLAQLFFASLLAAPSLAASASDWQGRSIYQLVTDRFAVASGDGPDCDTNARQYCNGTWQGVISHLDYIQNMGFDAVWISPVAANFEGESLYGQAYHGYWPNNITAINSHYGSENDLKALSSALHDRGMYLMLDVVVNHMAIVGQTPSYSNAFEPFNEEAEFHPFCWVTDYSNQTNVEQCWLGDQNVALVDLDTEDNDVVTAMNNWVQSLVSTYSVDGLRIDTVKHVRQDFWPGFASAAGVYTIGEVLSNDTTYMAPYTKVLDALLDYSTWSPLVAAFQTSFGNLSALASTVQGVQSQFKNGAFGTGSFLENHDQPRFANLCNDTALIANAMSWPFIHDGIPILYYGSEQSYAGGSDPLNREALWSSGYVENKPLVNQTKNLNAARKAAIAANSNFLTTAMTFPVNSLTTLAVSKAPILALFTNVGSSGSASWTVPGSASGYSANEALVEVLSCTAVTADGSGTVTAQAKSGMPQVLVPASALPKSGSVCASLATGSGSSNSSGGGGGKKSAAPAARGVSGAAAALGALLGALALAMA